MIDHIPTWVDYIFICAVVYTIIMFHFANNKPWNWTVVILGWCIIQSWIAYIGFYENTKAVPPRFAFLLIPTTFAIIYGCLPKQRNWVYRHRNLKISTFLHTVRIPVEISLFYLYIHKMVPKLMTFEGRNFDILAGITALIVGFIYLLGGLSKRGLLIWNYGGLVLVLFILFNGIFSSELPFQMFGFEQPNRGVIYFPYILLPGMIVPIVIYTHITDIMKLTVEL